MKSGYTFTISIFLLVSAFVFFKGEARILQILSGREATEPHKDSTVQKKKPPVKAAAKKKVQKNVSTSQTVDLASYFFQPVITAIKTVDKTTDAVSGNVLNYTVVISNSGTDATGLTFTDNIDPNTTLVPGSLKTSPIVFNDAYTAIGNVGISVPDADGILANDELGTNPQAVFTAVTNAATTQGGTISITAAGGITYTPAPGFTGNDTYDYTLTNDAGSSTGTITIAVSGMIWFVNNNSTAATADGRLNTPFKTVAAFQAVNDGAPSHPAANHIIFVHESGTDYTGNISLLNGQKLIGQDATTNLAAITGYNTYPYSTSLLPVLNSANGVIVNLTATGSDNVISLIGGGSATYTIRGLTIGNKVTGSGISGTTFGTANISETSINGTGQALNLTTGIVSASFTSVSSSSGTNAVSLTGITGTATMGTGSLTGSTGATFNVSGGSVTVTYSGNLSQSNNAALVNVAGSHTGTITFQTGTLSATNGTGLQLNAANGIYNFNGTTTLNGGDAGVDIVGTSLGSFTFSANTSITNPSGTAFNIGAAGVSTGGSGPVTYNGTISKTSAGRAIEIQNKTAGTVAFTGSVSSTSGSSGINLVNNTGATVNFTGGLTLNTGTNTAFNATGGGTISATQNNSTIVNTITTTTATALNVANTTVGAGGLIFRSINVNGATKGIALNNTGSGGLTISGTGTTPGSGGTIQNIAQRGIEIISSQNINLSNVNLTNANTADAGLAGVCEELNNGGCFAALYVSATTTVNLTRVNITTTAEQGINLNNVTALSINNCTVQGNGDNIEEGALKAIDLKGNCTITNSTFKNSAFRIAHIRNNSGNCHLTVSGSQFINEASNTSAIKQDCFQMRVNNSATATVLLQNSTFMRAGTAGIQVYAQDNSTVDLAITGCTIDRDGTLMKGVEVGSDHTARMNANVDGNPLITANGEVALNINSGTTSTTQATARNNTSIKGGNDPNLNAFAVVRVFAFAASNNKSLVTNNAITDLDAQAILSGSSNNSGAGVSTLNSTVQSNNITGTSGLTSSGIRVPTVTNTTSATTSNCSYITENTVTVTSPTDHLRIVGGSSTSSVLLPSTGNTATTVWNNNSNTPASPPAVITVQQIPGSTVTFGGSPCPQPTNTVLPTAVAFTTLDEEAVNTTVLTDEPLLESTNFITAKYEAPLSEEEPLENNEEELALQGNFATTAQTIVETTTPQNITLSGINLPAAKNLTVKFQVTVNNGLSTSVCSVSNQGSISGPGITTVLTDNDANSGNGINPTVTTILDVTDPVVNNCPSTVTVQTGTSNTTCSKTATWTEPTATDNCSGTLSFFSRSHVPGATFPVGTTPVTYVFKDAAGNQSTCTFNVVVEDNTPPVVSGCPGTITVQTGPGNTSCTQTATWTEPTATDNCGGSLAFFSRSHAPGASFNAGTTPVTYVFKDAAGNQGTCTFNVVVEDNTPPVVSGCPGTITVQTGPGNTSCTQTATWTEPTATDACTGAAILVSRSHAPGDAFSKGTTTVTYVFKDVANNQRSCSFDVVVEDNTPPLLTCPDNVVVVENPASSGSATVNYPAATATDNCSGVGAVQYSHASGTSFPIGTTTVNVSVTDATGNPATCSFTVTVNPACQITPPANVIVNAANGQCSAIVNYDAATTTGNCGTLTYSHASGSLFPVGTTTVTVSSESTGQSNSFTVTVNDNQDPVITTCPGPIIIDTDAGACTALIPFSDIDKAVATDNCETGLTVKYYLNYGTISQQQLTAAHSFAKGTTTVTVEARDACNNKVTCTFTVTVNDTEKPAITCPANITVNSAAAQCGAIVTFTGLNAATATDNCGTPTVNYSPASGSVFPIGETTVTATATDGSGNTKSCTFTVTVTPTADLSITKTASPTTVIAGNNVTYTLTVNNNGACDASNVSLSDVLPASSTFVSLTAPTGWTPTTPAVGAHGTVTATKTSLAANGSATFTLVVNANSNASGTLSNTATIAADTEDPDGINNSATAQVTLVSQADLSITKTASPSAPQAGTNLTYTLTVANNGPSDASNVSMSDVLPSGTTFVSLTAPTGWSATMPAVGANGTVTATKTSLAAGSGSQVFTLVVFIAANTAHGTVLTNTATVSSATTDPVSANNSATNNTTVINCVLTCPDNMTVYTDPNSTQCGANVTFSANATSGCGTVTYSTASGTVISGSFFPVGTTPVTATAATGQTCSFTVTVVDNTPPAVTGFDESTINLWPPNHKMRDVATYSSTDNCGTSNCVVTVTSNEPENGTGDGDTGPDWEVVGNTIRVRAERGNNKEVRVYDITLTCTDAHGNETVKRKQVRIAHNITAPVSGAPFKIGSTVPFTGVFWDKPGTKHTANWLIDDKTTVKASVTEPSGTRNGKVTGSYKFTTAGVYKLQMNVTDQNKQTSYCNTNEDLEAIVVIYDPNGGYVYGGGKFMSPAGALTSNPTVTGLVSYGFTVNYYKGATLPKGETQFEFKAGEFEFNALNFDYLSVSGARAQFRGSGKIIGGQSGVNFIMTVIDGQRDGTGTDKVRMKIYNKNTGAVIYDNMPGTGEAADPVTPVGANSNVVISGGKASTATKQASQENVTSEEGTALTVTASPNPSNNNFVLTISSDNTKDVINMRVVDGYGRAIEIRKLAAASVQTVRLGGNLRPGWYLVEVVQGAERKQLKLLKLSD